MQSLSALLCGTLVSCLCELGCFGSFVVVQKPSAVMVKEGESVQITCCWNKSFEGPKVKWKKDQRVVNFSQTNQRFHTETWTNSCTAMTITNTYQTDAGFYICEVTQDLPVLLQEHGAGTNVTYKERKFNVTTVPSPSTKTAPFSRGNGAVLLGSVCGAVGLMCMCVCLTVWKVSRNKQRAERIVIREGPPSEGDTPETSEEEEHSSVNSRGSTQWYMVPVYESYFDLQRNDEQESAAPEKTSSPASEKTSSSASEKTSSPASEKTSSTASVKIGSTASKKTGSTVSKKTRLSASLKIGSTASKNPGSPISKKTRSSASVKIGSTASKNPGSPISKQTRSSASVKIGSTVSKQTRSSASVKIGSTVSKQTGSV